MSTTAPGRSVPALAPRAVGDLGVEQVLPRAYADATVRLGRELTAAELRIDIVQADRDLAEGKRRLLAALDKEKKRVVELNLRGVHATMKPTPEMVKALAYLHERGRLHARSELGKIGIYPTTPREQGTPQRVMALVREKLVPRLPSIQGRINRAVSYAVEQMDQVRSYAEPYASGIDFGGLAEATIATRLAEQIPGTLAAASDLISSGFTAGLSDGFDGSGDLIASWQYTAVMDDGTCDPCSEHDGDEFETLEEAMAVLPDFGPNPDCDGGDRCRCRLVPTGATDEAAAAIASPADGGAGQLVLGSQIGSTEIIGLFDHTLIDEAATNIEAAQRARKGITQARAIHRLLDETGMNGDTTAVIQRDANGKLIGAANYTWRTVGDETIAETKLAGGSTIADEKLLRTIAERLAIDDSRPSMVVRADTVERRELLDRLGFTSYGGDLRRTTFENLRKLAGMEPPPELRPFAHYKDSTLTTQIGRTRKGVRELELIDWRNPGQESKLGELRQRLAYLERERELRRAGIRPPGEVERPKPQGWEQPPPRNARMAELQRRYREDRGEIVYKRGHRTEVNSQAIDDTGRMLYEEIMERFQAEVAADTRQLYRPPTGPTRDQGRRLLKQVLGEIRQLGEGPDAELKLEGHETSVRALRAAADHYPREWFSRDVPAYRVSHIRRGHFKRFPREIALSGYGDSELERVGAHELGHWAEVHVPGILQMESDFYEYRTADEELVSLGTGYGSHEKTRLDRFERKYMGKDYYGAAYEIVSLGLEFALDGKWRILQRDPELARLIFGVLALL